MNRLWIVLFLLLNGWLRAASPNVVLITLDTTRRDALSCYGQEKVKTPALDRLANISHQFLNAYAPVPQTLPSHASLLTGLHPFEHGVRDNFRQTLPPSFTTLPEALKGRGYQTAAVLASVVLNRRFGLDQGIAAYDDAIDSPTGQRRADAVTALALERLGRLKPPFFLWVHYYDPHYPYEAPGCQGSPHPYLEEVRYMDGQMAPLLERLDPASTLVVVAGDHGEMLGEHGEEEHGILLYEGAVQVPLLIHLPGQTRPERHGRTVSLSSVFATVLETLQIPNPDARAHPSLFSKAPLPPVYLETFHPYFGYQWSPLRGLLRGSDKLIASVRGDELYRLDRDPGERLELTAQEPALARELKAALDAVCPEKTMLPPLNEEAPVPDELQEQMESLGYLTGSHHAGGASPSPESLLHPREVADLVAFIARRAPRLLAAGEARAVLNETKQALKRDPTNVRLINLAGTATLQQGNPERALEIFAEGLKLAPNLHTLLGSMGRCYALMGRPREAEEYLRKAIAANPFQPSYYAYLAQVHLDQNKLPEARAAVEEARRQGRSSPELVLVSGMLAQAQADYAGAIRAYEEFLRFEPERLEALRHLALCYSKIRDYSRAWSTVQKGLQRAPDDFHLNRQAFEIALLRNDRAKARAVAARFISLFPMTEEARTMRELFPDLP